MQWSQLDIHAQEVGPVPGCEVGSEALNRIVFDGGQSSERAGIEVIEAIDLEIHEVEKLIAGWVEGVFAGDGVTLSFAPPPIAGDGTRVSAYLLELGELPMAQARAEGKLSLRYKLRYLITTWADSPTEQNRMLTELAFAATAHPELGVDLTPVPHGFWSAFELPPRPSLVVEVVMRRSAPDRDAKRVIRPVVELTTPVWLSGMVVGPKDVPIPDALVEMPELQRACRTDNRGRFALACAPRPKAKRLRVTAKGAAFDTTVDELGSHSDPVIIRIQFKEGLR